MSARCLAAAALLGLLLAVTAIAQDFRATISGLVTDPSKAAVPNAAVKAVRVGTNETTEAKTNAAGFYTIPYLAPGPYNIEISAAGFKTVKRENIVLQVADKLNLTITLEIGQVAESITVVGEQELISTATASRGLVFDPIKTQELPLNGRQSYMLMALTPGVIFTQEEFGATGFSGTRGWDVNGSYKINGGRGANQFLLNGAPISSTGEWEIAVNVDAIQEFKVMTNTYDAQFGRTWGGTVNTTTKSGTNNWHGSVFDYLRNSVLDANTTQNNIVGAPRGKHITNQFGGVIGGAIRQDKDFVLYSHESFRERVPFPRVSDAPPMDLRDGQGFSNWGINIFDPMTTRLCRNGIDPPGGGTCLSGGTYIRTQFPNNQIPDKRISPIGKKILSYYPAPNSPDLKALTQNYFAPGNVGKYHYDQPMGRWDRVLNEKDRIYAMVTYQHGQEFRSQSGFPGAAMIGDIRSQRTYQGYNADWTRVMSATRVLDVRLSFYRFTSIFPNGDLESGLTADQLGIKMPKIPNNPRLAAPRISMDDASTVFGNGYSWSTTNHWDFAPSMTQTRGRHSLHYGAEWAYVTNGNYGMGNTNGAFAFRRWWTQQYTGRGLGQKDGSGAASLLLGLPNDGSVEFNDSFYRTNPYLAGYLQDDWKATHKLTFNLGLRYDVQIPFKERFNRVNSGFDFGAKNPLSDQIIANWKQMKTDYDAKNAADIAAGKDYPYPNPPSAIYGGKLFAGVNGEPERPYKTDWSTLQPRIGAAYNVRSKTVIRGGFGIFHRTVSQGNYTDGFSQSTPYIRSLDADITPSGGLTGPYSLENPFPNGYVPPTQSRLGLLTNVGRGVSFDTKKRVMPRTYEYSFTIERELPWSMVIDASYSGNSTRKDGVGYQWDNPAMPLILQAQKDPFFLNRKLPNPLYGVVPLNTSFGSSATINAYDLNRPYPLFQGVTANANGWGRYRYDAFQLRFEKRAFGNRDAGVLTFVVAYTLSKAFEANHRLNDWNYQEPLIHELDNQDKTHGLAISGVWDLPLGNGRRWLRTSNPVGNAMASGWTMDWIATFYSGYPVGKPDTLFSCATYTVPKQTPSQWFNNDKSCYSDRAPYTLRTVEDRFPNIRNPAEPQVNFAIAKNVRLRESWKLQIRGESFNLMNTPIPRGPDTGWRNARFGMLPLAQNNFPRLVQIAAKFIF